MATEKVFEVAIKVPAQAHVICLHMTTGKVFEVAMIARTNDQAQAQAHQRQH